MVATLRSRAKTVLKVTVSLALIGAIVHAIAGKEGLDALLERVRGADPRWLVFAVVAQLLAVAAGVLRWQQLLRSQRLELGTSWLFRTFLVGRFIGAFTPSTAGLDVYRAVAVARRTGAKGPATAVIVVEKLFGLAALSAVAVALLPFGAARFLGRGGVIGALVVGAGCVLAYLLLSRRTIFTRLFERLPSKVRRKLAGSARILRARPLGRARGATVFGLGVASHVATAGVFVATAAALGLDIAVVDTLVVGVAIIVATLLPISVGGVGVREGTAVLLLGLVGVSVADATLVGLLGYLTAQPPALLGGLLSLAPPRGEEHASTPAAAIEV